MREFSSQFLDNQPEIECTMQLGESLGELRFSGQFLRCEDFGM